MHYLTIATCIKGEDSYIDDYILIHKKLGVQAFIFMDRDGDNLTNRFKGRDDIVVIKYPEPYTHHASHAHIIKNCQGFSRWMAFMDCDQVLFSPTNMDLKVTLQEFEPYAQIQPVWNSFGSSGYDTRIQGSVYERFTRRAKEEHPTNNHTQGIADISRCVAQQPPDPHRVVVRDGEVSVDENHRVLGSTPHVNPHTQNKIFVAHYITKSKEEWLVKNSKGRSDVPGQKMPLNDYENHNAYMNEVEDTRIKEFWEKYCK